MRRPRDDAVNRVLTDGRNAIDAGRSRAVRRGDRIQLGDHALHLVLADPHAADLAGKSSTLLALRAGAKARRPAMPGLGHEQLAVTRKREVTRVVKARDHRGHRRMGRPTRRGDATTQRHARHRGRRACNCHSNMHLIPLGAPQPHRPGTCARLLQHADRCKPHSVGYQCRAARQATRLDTAQSAGRGC